MSDPASDMIPVVSDPFSVSLLTINAIPCHNTRERSPSTAVDMTATSDFGIDECLLPLGYYRSPYFIIKSSTYTSNN